MVENTDVSMSMTLGEPTTHTLHYRILEAMVLTPTLQTNSKTPGGMLRIYENTLLEGYGELSFMIMTIDIHLLSHPHKLFSLHRIETMCYHHHIELANVLNLVAWDMHGSADY